MRGVVCEIKGKYAVILSNDASVRRIRNRDYIIGDVVELENKFKFNFNQLNYKYAYSFASIVILLTLGYLYVTPYTYVSVDVNPSIEYQLNIFNRVLSAKGVNDDGKVILEKLKLTNLHIDTAIEKTIDELKEEDYLTNDGGIVVSTSSKDEDKSNDLLVSITDEVNKIIEEDEIELEIEAYAVGKERVVEAKEMDTTPGKLNLVQKLQDSNKEDVYETKTWINKSVKDIMKEINKNKNDKNYKSTDINEDQDDEVESSDLVNSQSSTDGLENTSNNLSEENHDHDYNYENTHENNYDQNDESNKEEDNRFENKEDSKKPDKSDQNKEEKDKYDSNNKKDKYDNDKKNDNNNKKKTK